jgi:hypothetical protein
MTVIHRCVVTHTRSAVTPGNNPTCCRRHGPEPAAAARRVAVGFQNSACANDLGIGVPGRRGMIVCRVVASAVLIFLQLLNLLLLLGRSSASKDVERHCCVIEAGAAASRSRGLIRSRWLAR